MFSLSAHSAPSSCVSFGSDASTLATVELLAFERSELSKFDLDHSAPSIECFPFADSAPSIEIVSFGLAHSAQSIEVDSLDFDHSAPSSDVGLFGLDHSAPSIEVDSFGLAHSAPNIDVGTFGLAHSAPRIGAFDSLAIGRVRLCSGIEETIQIVLMVAPKRWMRRSKIVPSHERTVWPRAKFSWRICAFIAQSG